MGKSKKDHQKSLEDLRSRFATEDLSPLKDVAPPEFVSQVRKMVDHICKENLNKGIIGWGRRCAAARNKRRLTLEKVAEYMGIDHSSISQQEALNGLINVKLYYLEAFSIIYGASPYELLGIKLQVSEHIHLPMNQKLPDESMKEFITRGKIVVLEEGLEKRDEDLLSPMLPADTKFSRYCRIIMDELFEKGSSEKREYLNALMKLARLREREKLIPPLTDALHIFPEFNAMMEIDLTPHMKKGPVIWNKHYILGELDSSQVNTPEYELYYTYNESYLILSDLKRECSPLLETFAKMALASDNCRKLIQAAILFGGYPKDRLAFMEYKVEAAFVKDFDENKYGAKARGEIWEIELEELRQAAQEAEQRKKRLHRIRLFQQRYKRRFLQTAHQRRSKIHLREAQRGSCQLAFQQRMRTTAFNRTHQQCLKGKRGS